MRIDFAPRPKANFLQKIMSPSGGFVIFVIGLGITYVLMPLIANLVFEYSNQYFDSLALISTVAIVFLFGGYSLPFLDSQLYAVARTGTFNPVKFAKYVLFAFVVFFLLSAVTAPSIPILSALQGSNADTLSLERGNFFKARTGAWSLLIYANTFFASVLMPYSVVHLFAAKSPYRYLSALVFFLYCICFLAKALFLFLLLPLMVYVAQVGKLKGKSLVASVAAAIGLLLSLTIITTDSSIGVGTSAVAPFFSARYLPQDAFDMFLWRSFAVPLFTASDTLTVHDSWFGAQYLLGSTSSFISAMFGMERINLERYVFEYQFGGWNDIANSNAVYITDAYANFGILGVVLFSIFIGVYARTFAASQDIGYRCLWPVFFLSLFSSSLIGVLLSNGFAYILVHALNLGVKIVPKLR